MKILDTKSIATLRAKDIGLETDRRRDAGVGVGTNTALPWKVPKFGKRFLNPGATRQTQRKFHLSRLRFSENILLVRPTPAPLAKLDVA
jgi:hypothetical protein